MSNRKDPLPPTKIVSAADLSIATTTSPVTTVTYHDNIVYQVNITGSPVGTLTVEASDDYVQSTPFTLGVAGNWVPLTGMSAAISGADVVIFDLNQIGPPYVRAKYTKTSGTGSMDIYISGKQV